MIGLRRSRLAFNISLMLWEVLLVQAVAQTLQFVSQFPGHSRTERVEERLDIIGLSAPIGDSNLKQLIHYTGSQIETGHVE